MAISRRRTSAPVAGRREGSSSHSSATRSSSGRGTSLRISAARGISTELIGGSLPACAFPYVVDATGSPAGLRAAVAMVEPRGTVILKSTVHGEVPVDTAPVIVNEITLVGSRCGRFEPALELLARLIARAIADAPIRELGHE